MKKTILLLVLTLVASVAVAQKPYTVAFYHLENLFDLYDDPDTHD